MTTTAPLVALEPLDLAAMLCSRVCHDVISPVGAIVNGLEVLEDDSDPSMRDVALDLIKRSAAGASAKLQFCRLAFGAAGSAGASIDTGDADKVARAMLESDRTKLDWAAPRQFLAKNKVKLLLNLCQIANATIPRGGHIHVSLIGEGETSGVKVFVTGTNTIQPYYAGLVARECGLAVRVESGPEGLSFLAEPVAAPATAEVDLTAH
jgi:histidine phosphotransferase ChpT